MPTAPPRRRSRQPWGRGSTPAAGWVEAKAVRVIGAPPCSGGTRSIVPGGEVRGTLGCAEFDAAAVEAAAEIRATGRPRSNVPPRAGRRRGLPRAARRRRGWSSSRPPTLRDRCSVRWSEGRSVVLLGEDGRRVRRSAPPPRPRGDRTRSERWYSGPRRAGDRRHAGDAPTFAGRVHRCDGVARRRGHYVEDLRSRGFADEDLARIGARSGSTSAVAAPRRSRSRSAAGLVAARHGREGGWLDR